MAGDWIKVEKSTLRKPEVAAIARLLGVKRREAIGLLLEFWAWLDDVCVDGVVDACVDADVDAMFETGFAATLSTVGWATFERSENGLTGRMLIPNSQRHFGESSKKRALKSERQARWRASHVDARVDAHVDAPPSTREEKRREENIKPKSVQPARKRASPLPPDFGISDRVKDWAAEKGYSGLPRYLEAFLSKVAAKGYTYVDWDAAFMNSIREDWGKVRQIPAAAEAPRQAAHMPARLPSISPRTEMPQHIGSLLAQFKPKAVA